MSLDICSARSADQELCAVCQSISLSPTTALASNLVGPRHGAAAAAEPYVAISIRLGNANINLQRRVVNATEVARAARSYQPDGRAQLDGKMAFPFRRVTSRWADELGPDIISQTPNDFVTATLRKLVGREEQREVIGNFKAV